MWTRFFLAVVATLWVSPMVSAKTDAISLLMGGSEKVTTGKLSSYDVSSQGIFCPKGGEHQEKVLPGDSREDSSHEPARAGSARS